MFSAVRRGLFLGRALRASTVRAAPSRVSQLPSLWQSSSLKAFPATTRHLHSSPVLGDAAAATATAQPKAPNAQGEERITKFEALAENGLVNENIVDAITKGMGISDMTDVQSLTIHETLRGQDVFAQAKTGTGKTLAFVVPVLQNILQCDPSLATRKTFYPMNSGRRSSAADIRAIIISPTRELAEQIAREAMKVARNTGVIVQTAVGGTRKREGLERINTQGCHVLVGTPGRLHDILSDEHSGVTAPKMTALVLDEADRLLDIGFASAIDEIQTLLPERESRQTLMFSATLPPEVIDMVRSTMKPDFKFLKTVKEHETPTHHKVPQRAVFLNGLENQYIALYELAQQAIAKHKEDPENNKPFKAIVYYNSTAEVALAKAAFQRMRVDPSDKWAADPFDGIAMTEMHSRLTQSMRTRQSESFRRAKSGILFSSDVTARGMDFPDVSHVIQIGLPRDQETYVHRLGRTARANKEGEGWLFCAPTEIYLLKQTLRSIPIKEDSKTLSTASVDLANVEALSPTAAETFAKFSNVFQRIPYKEKEAAYMGLLGRACQSRDRAEGVRTINDLAMRAWGLSMPPKISDRLVQTLGLRRVKEVNTSESPVDDRDRGFGGRDRSFGGRDRGSSGRDRSFGGRDRGFGGRDREFGGRDREFGERRRGFGPRDGSSGGRGRGLGPRDGGSGGRDRGFSGRSGGFGGRGRGGDDFSDRGFKFNFSREE